MIIGVYIHTYKTGGCTHMQMCDNEIKLLIFTEEEHLCPGQMCGKNTLTCSWWA